MKPIYSRILYRLIVCGLLSLCLPSLISAQIADRVFKSDPYFGPERKGQLLFELDNLSFFKNNEFSGPVMKGYTLPGFWVQPKLVYYPLENIKLEVGAHMLFYHGAYQYPLYSYTDIPNREGDYSRAHVIPFFRGQIALSDQWSFVIGNIYGAANHNLIEPLYSPELNLSADPETGLQILFDSKHVDMDVWVNWQSFIFRNDTHQEVFTFGLSTNFKYNDPHSKFHFYSPLQVLAQHRGGEIDTLTVNSVQTLMNGAVGVGALWNINKGVFKNLNLEVDATGYYQQAGSMWPFDNGYGVYVRASADIYDFRIKTSYWECDEYISIFGLPFYGALSTKEEGSTFKKPQMIYAGVEYSRSFGKGYTLGVDLDLYHNLSGEMNNPETGLRPVESSTAFAFGVYLRLNPSFLLKSF